MIGRRNNFDSTFDWIIVDREEARFLRIDFPRSVSRIFRGNTHSR